MVPSFGSMTSRAVNAVEWQDASSKVKSNPSVSSLIIVIVSIALCPAIQQN